MKGINLMKLSCAEAASVCTKAEYREANLREKWRLKLHLFFCKTCKSYYNNNRKLSGLLKQAHIQSCPAAQKEIFKQQIKNGSSNTSENK